MKQTKRRQRRRKTRFSVRHAAYRLAERYDGDVFISEVEYNIQHGYFKYVYRQTGTRSICQTTVRQQRIYFVLSRVSKKPVTVLSRAQVTAWGIRS